jgi:hypothetical protein
MLGRIGILECLSNEELEPSNDTVSPSLIVTLKWRLVRKASFMNQINNNILWGYA